MSGLQGGSLSFNSQAPTRHFCGDASSCSQASIKMALASSAALRGLWLQLDYNWNGKASACASTCVHCGYSYVCHGGPSPLPPRALAAQPGDWAYINPSLWLVYSHICTTWYGFGTLCSLADRRVLSRAVNAPGERQRSRIATNRRAYYLPVPWLRCGMHSCRSACRKRPSSSRSSTQSWTTSRHSCAPSRRQSSLMCVPPFLSLSHVLNSTSRSMHKHKLKHA